MSVYKTEKSRFWQYDFQLHGRRFHGSTGCASKRDAERFEADRRRRAALGESSKPSITVDEACGIYWMNVAEHQASSATTKYQIENIITALGKNHLLGDIAVLDLDRMVARRRAKVADSSVNRETQLARRIWRYAASRGFDVADVNWSKLILREPVERVRELSANEEVALFAQLPPDIAAVAEFAMLSGQRRASVISLLWSRVDLAGARASVRIKGGAWHAFPLTPRMIAIIANRPKVCAQVFTYECERPAPPRADRPRRVKGVRYPLTVQGWQRKWAKALADAGIDDFRFHDLRHTAGTRVLRATGNMKAVQKLLGHTTITTTARYAHATEDDVRSALLATESRNSPGATPAKKAKSGGKLRSVG